jgi:hypothetical protein
VALHGRVVRGMLYAEQTSHSWKKRDPTSGCTRPRLRRVLPAGFCLCWWSFSGAGFAWPGAAGEPRSVGRFTLKLDEAMK